VNLGTARSPRRGFLWALAASLLLHALTLSVATLRPRSAAPPAIQGALAPMAVTLLPPAGSTPSPLQPPAPAPRAFAPPPRPVAPPPEGVDGRATARATTPAMARAAQAPSPATPSADASSAQAAPDAPDSSGSAAPADAPAPPRPADATAADATAAGTAPAATRADAADGQPPGAGSDAAPPVGSIRFPRSGRLEYAVTIGTPPTPVGRATYAWEASEAAYRLSLSAETTGLVGLLRRVRVVQTSEGRITPEGLRPDAFAMDRGPNARNEFARFDWAAKQLTFGYPDAVQTAALGPGAQDTLSLILQFAFVPIGDGRRDVLLTTGRKLYVQSYERVAEEVIETPAGNWRAWHLRRVRAQAGDEGYDMWLATDRPFLPVRIRWTDRNGRVTSATLDTVRLARD